MKHTLDLLPIKAFQGRKTPIGGHSLRLYGGSDSGNSALGEDYFTSLFPEYAAVNAPVSVAPVAAAPVEVAPVEAAPVAAAPVAAAPAGIAALPAANPWEQPLNSLYQEVLGRDVDPTGLSVWGNALNSGKSLEQVRNDLLLSPEYQARLANVQAGRPADTPAGIASLPAAAKPAQWEYQPEEFFEGGGSAAPYYLDVNSGARKEVGQPVQATGVTPVDPNTLSQHVGPNFQGTPTQFYDDQGNLKGILVDAVRAGLNTREGELILDPMSLGLALKPGETASLDSKIQQRNEQGQLLFVDPVTGGTTIYNTGVPAETGSTVKDMLYINERKHGGQIPADTAQGMMLMAAMMLTGGVGGALMDAAGFGAAGAGGVTGSLGAGAVAGGDIGAFLAADAAAGAGGINWGAIATSAGKSAALNAGMTAIKGGSASDILKAGLIGAVSSGAGSAIGGLTEGLGSLETTLAKAGVQAGITGLTGGNVANSLIASAVGAALPAALDKIIPEGTFDGLPPTIKNALTNATASAVTAASTGGNISDAALNSIIKSAGDAAFKYASDAMSGKGMTDAEATNLINSNLLPANMQTPAAGNTISNADLSDQLFEDVFGSSSATTNSTTTPAQGSTSGNLDTGYRAEAFPVAAPVDSTFTPLVDAPTQSTAGGSSYGSAVPQVDENGKVITPASQLTNENTGGLIDYLANAPREIRDQAVGVFEVAMNQLGFAVGNVAAAGYGAGKTWYNLATGEPVDPKAIDQVANEIAKRLSYTPVTTAGKNLNEVVNAIPEFLTGSSQGLPPVTTVSTLPSVGPIPTPNIGMFSGDLTNAIANAQRGITMDGAKSLSTSVGEVIGGLLPKIDSATTVTNESGALTGSSKTPQIGYRPSENAAVPKDVAAFFDDIFAKTDEVVAKDKTPDSTAGFPDTREVLTPEKVESLRKLLIEPDYRINPSYPGGTSFDKPTTTTTTTTTSPVTQRATDTSTSLLAEFAEPIKPIDLISSAYETTTPTKTTTTVTPTTPTTPTTPVTPVTPTKPTTPTTPVTPVTPTTPTTPTTPVTPVKPVTPTPTQIDTLQKTLTDTIAANEKAGLTRDQATNKAITDLAKSTKTSDDELKKLVGTTSVANQTFTKNQVDGLQKKLTDTIAANEKAGLSRDKATDKAIADLSKSSSLADADLKKLIGTTSVANQTFTKTQVDGLQKKLTDTITANEKAGLTRDKATDKAIADLSKSTSLADADLKKLIGTTSVANQTFTKTQVDNLQKTLTTTIAANEKAGMARDKATDKAIADLSKSTSLADADLKKLVSASSVAGQNFTKDQVAGLQKTLTATIAANEKAGMKRDAATDKAIADLAKSTKLADADLKKLITASTTASQDFTKTQVAGLEKTLTTTIAANEKAGMKRDAATDKAIADLAKSTGKSDAELKALIGTTSTANQTFTKTQVDGLQKTLTTTIAANEKAGMERDEATDKAISELAKSTGESDAEIKKLIETSSTANQTFTKDQVAGLQKTLTETIAANEKAGMERDEATDKAIAELAESTGTSIEDLKTTIADANTALSGSISDMQSNLEGLITANELAGSSRDKATADAIESLATTTGASIEELTKLISTGQADLTEAVSGLKSDIGAASEAGQKYTKEQVAGLQDSLSKQIADNELAGLSRSQATDKALDALAKSTGTSVADLKTLINTSSEASQQYTKAQVEGLQNSLSKQIADNEASGLSRSQATDKAITDLATQTKMSKDEIIKLITATGEAGQKYTKEQIDFLEKALGKQITDVGSDLTDLSTNFQSYQTQQQQAAAAAAKQAKTNQLVSTLSQTQQVSAKTPPGAEIDYLYDIGGESIFAPKKGSKAPQKDSYYDLYDGGFIDDAGSIEDLYNLLGSK